MYLVVKTWLEVHGFLAGHSIDAAEAALGAIERARTLLQEFPWSCRASTAIPRSRFRELVIPFGKREGDYRSVACAVLFATAKSERFKPWRRRRTFASNCPHCGQFPAGKPCYVHPHA